MEKILKVHNVNDYADYIGAPRLHPLVSVIHYDELEHCRHSLNNYDVYAMFIADETLPELVYGMTRYDLRQCALMCVAPGQIGGKTDTGEEIQTRGWALLFDPQLLHGTHLDARMPHYSFFSYNTHEALLMDENQRRTIVSLLEGIRSELTLDLRDSHSRNIVVALIETVLEHVARFYAAQLASPQPENNDILTRFENLLRRYYDKGLQELHGIPTVKFCARELFFSPNYFADLVKQITGDTATNTIRRFIMQRAKTMLISGSSVSQVSDEIGFDYPQHFTRMFKSHFGITPSSFLKKSGL